MIGCLMYVMLCTRPDLRCAISILSRIQSKNNKELWSCLKHLLKYIKETLELKLSYEKKSYNNFIVGYVYSDWGSDEVNRKSTTGFLFIVFDTCIISWCTRKQNTVAISSTEAEYMALFEAVREAIWLKSLIEKMTSLFQSIIIYV